MEFKNSSTEQELPLEQLLFEDELKYQKYRFQIYSAIILFNVLLVASFLLLGAGLLFSLTCGASIGLSTSMLFLSTFRIGNKTFVLNFTWFLSILLGFAYFGMPEALIRTLEKIGISSELMVLACMFQAVLFFMYVCYWQFKDFNRKAIKVDSEEIKVDGRLVAKKEVRKKQKKERIKKDPSKKRFLFNRRSLKDGSEDADILKIYAHYRQLALYVLAGVSFVIPLIMVFYWGASSLIAYLFIAMFILTAFLILIPMIKPGTQKFWTVVSVIIFVIVSSFLASLST